MNNPTFYQGRAVLCAAELAGFSDLILAPPLLL
jgi:hypothetical protein